MQGNQIPGRSSSRETIRRHFGKWPRAPIVRHWAEAPCVDYLDPIVFHIAGQAEHHRKATFQEEHRRLLEQYDIPFDERYVWD